jgi:hypothetical protein
MLSRPSKRREAVTGKIRAVLVVALIAASGLLAPSASAEPRPSTAKVGYAIGDSVMLGAKGQLKRRGFIVNAAVSRQAYSAPAMVRKRSSSLPRNVVVHLGTNGTFPLETCKRIVMNAGRSRRVFLLTVAVRRSWERSNNAVIRRCAEAFPAGRVTVVDWKSLASRHPSWFYSDGIHLKSAGAVGYARLVDRAVSGR